MSNYPPGAKNDPRAPYNAPDHSHEHRWELVGDEIIFEDGAAIFHYECRYAEGEYGQGWQCEETKFDRFDLSYIWFPNGEGHPINPDHTEIGSVRIENAIIMAESEGSVIGPSYVDPDPDDGRVEVKWAGHKAVFLP